MSNNNNLRGFLNNQLKQLQTVFKAKKKEPATNYGTAGQPLVANSEQVLTRRIYPNENKINPLFLGKEAIKIGDARKMARECPPIRNNIELYKSWVARCTGDFFVRGSSKQNRQCKELSEFFKYPDGETIFDSWLASAIEEYCVAGTICAYPEKSLEGKVLGIYLIDSATIEKKVDYRGLTPREGVAYQQVIDNKIVSLKKDELVYFTKHNRVETKHQLSLVQQCFKVGMLYNLSFTDIYKYLSEGNVPNTVMSIKDSNINQIDLLLAHIEEQVSQNKHLLKVVPEATFHNLKQEPVQKDVLELCTRLICATFRIGVESYLSQINRATSETSRAASNEDGLLDLLDHLANFINHIVHHQFGYKDVEFRWNVDVPVDAELLANRVRNLVAGGILTVNEARAELGYPALKEADKPKQPEANADESEEGQDDDQAEDDKGSKADGQVEKFQKLNERIADPEIAEAYAVADEAYSVLFAKMLDEQREAILDALQDGRQVDANLLEALELSPAQIEEFFDEFERVGKAVALVVLDRTYDTFNVTNSQAFIKTVEQIDEYLVDRAGLLIGKQKRNGVIIDNPNKAYAITETTRDAVKVMIGKAMEEGWSNDKFAAELQEQHQFSSERAMAIARTETTSASNDTALNSYKNAGFSKKKWSSTYDNNACETCLGNESQGPIDVNAPFNSGVLAPPAHTNCRCTLLPHLDQ